MKRPTRKLTLQRETIRALRSIELAIAVGGATAAPMGETIKEVCTLGVIKPPAGE